MREQLKWYDDKADNSPWINALAELRQRATREGHCFQHVQAITVAIDQYAEKALGNRGKVELIEDIAVDDKSIPSFTTAVRRCYGMIIMPAERWGEASASIRF